MGRTLSSGAMMLKPVMFPPGRARFATNPRPTGLLLVMTIGMRLVAWRAALVASDPAVKMTSILRLTSSSARLSSRSGCPEASRNSTTRFCPSTKPKSRSPWRNALSNGDEAAPCVRMPSRGTNIAGCCARAVSGHAATAPRSVMKSRRLIPISLSQDEASYRFNRVL
jgi:hypothetical protein